MRCKSICIWTPIYWMIPGPKRGEWCALFLNKKKVFFLSNGCAQGINFKPTWREWKPESSPCAAWIMENANCYSCNTVTSSILHYARPSLFSISCPLFSLASLNYSSYLLSISSPSSANPLSHPALSPRSLHLHRCPLLFFCVIAGWRETPSFAPYLLNKHFISPRSSVVVPRTPPYPQLQSVSPLFHFLCFTAVCFFSIFYSHFLLLPLPICLPGDALWPSSILHFHLETLPQFQVSDQLP